jgi:altronate hydrolase
MKTLTLHPTDNVVVATTPLPACTDLVVNGVRCHAAVDRGHKVAISPIAVGGAIRKLGQTIGIATREISAGDWVHDHNIRNPSAQEIQSTASSSAAKRGFAAEGPSKAALHFKGYRRPRGRAATRNYIGILTTVNCSATVARGIADTFRAPGALDRYPNVDGVVAFTHATGCGMQAGSAGHAILQRTIEGYLAHPNFAAVLLIGLGCEVNRGGKLHLPDGLDADRVGLFDIQDVGGTRKAIDEGVRRVRDYLELADTARREDIPVSELVVGLQCGGSDAFSALTANPALGIAADLLIAHGGTAILSETPEVAPWADLLCARAISANVAQKMRDKVKWWEDYAAANGASLDGNPSPGNRAGGLSTIAEKALGAIAKGGHSALADVCGYAERITRRGLVFMDSPGFDPVSATGQIASGANLICFTTGRGSVFGAKPAPSLKLATNSEIYARMPDDMDIDCGGILDGRTDLAALGRDIFTRILETASGARTCSERLDIGENEFAPWQLGAVL